MAFADLVNSIASLVDSAVIPLLYALAFILFLIGMVRFFFMGGEEQRQKGRVFMLWGIIGFVVLFSVWSIVRLFLGILPS
jgi:heme/copper-type cytochrome/quinol oxidase subunit 4